MCDEVAVINTGAIAAYWELDFARRTFDVQSEAVRLAEEQFASINRQAEQGILAAVDVTAAQTQVATFQANQFLAQGAVAQAENTLKAMMLPDNSDRLWANAVATETQDPPRAMLPRAADYH